MKRLTTGLTPAEFLTIINQNFIELADIRAVGHYDSIVAGDDIVSKINTYYGSSIVTYGNANVFKYSFENVLLSNGCLLDPSGLTLTWLEDFLRISFTANSSVQHEIYESVNGGAYALVTTLNEGVITYDYHTWQNATLDIKVRAKNGTIYSDYSSTSVITPWVFKMDQSTLIQVDIKRIVLSALLKDVIIYWGDGNHTHFSLTGDTEITYDYASTGQYWVWITGDVNFIAAIEWYSQSAILHDTVITKWILPTALTFGHFYGNEMIGDITNIAIPANCGGAYLSGNAVTCNIADYDSLMPAVYWDIHLISSIVGGISGDVTDWVLPLRNAHIVIFGTSASGDLTAWTPWGAVTYGTVVLGLQGGNFTGDLSGWTIPDKLATIQCNSGCHFTKLPRGNFRNVLFYEFTGNSCNTAEIDNILAYIDAYFVGGVVPLVNCVYRFTGAGMGTPSAAGLASRTSILGKYTAEGKTCAIYVNP
jgi:hypothetical protein